MRLLKFLFTVSSAVTSFFGVIYLFNRFQGYINEDQFECNTHLYDDFDSDESVSEAVSSERSDLSGVYYKSMDPEEISESN